MNPTAPTPATACTPADPCGLETAFPWQGQRVALAEARSRFEREAQWAVCDTGHYRCRYYVWGDGPPLVCVHGLCDDARSFLLPLALLSLQFRCIAYDLPNGGGDGCRLGRYRHSDYVADLFALLDHLDLRQAYLFGASFGSTIALSALLARPERIPRAVLQGGFARRSLAGTEVALAKLARYWPGRMRRLPFHAARMRAMHEKLFFRQSREIWDFCEEGTGTSLISAVAHRALALHRFDLRPLLPTVRQPILLICGESDPLVPKKCEEELLDGLPNATRVEIAGCGHMALFSHPEIVAGLVDRFLTPPPCRGPNQPGAPATNQPGAPATNQPGAPATGT